MFAGVPARRCCRALAGDLLLSESLLVTPSAVAQEPSPHTSRRRCGAACSCVWETASVCSLVSADLYAVCVCVFWEEVTPTVVSVLSSDFQMMAR